MEDERTIPDDEAEDKASDPVEPTTGDSYSGPDPEDDAKGDGSDEDQGT